ncbi:DUF1801 domain-containing protein [Dyadobacter sp. CY326]|uniref:DUF1801 domain-containing protein n=1 Tax=Dyadobacter sp. CY326 TaxID=2907300 RepID=UPI001F1E2815|nr:DUF1801 domain-containing protein [Dyadobacter sp. CY326]MCE7065001.1 DUF1801 domain-containing protein [Dyadobacter sp. CY326]
MMLKEIDAYFYNKPEPVGSYLASLRHFVLHDRADVTEAWRYSMPFYLCKGKRFCYIWTDKKTTHPYLGIVDGNRIDHPALIAEKRSRMKILRLDPEEDMPIDLIREVLEMAIAIL